jgi:hypothetical protein
LLIFPSDDEEDEDEEDEDETAELLRELEKIKRERAEEQARKVSIRSFVSCQFYLSRLPRNAKQMLQMPPFARRKSQQQTP